MPVSVSMEILHQGVTIPIPSRVGVTRASVHLHSHIAAVSTNEKHKRNCNDQIYLLAWVSQC